MKRKLFAVWGLLLSLCVLLSGCGSDEHILLASIERNIIKEEYDENYAHYDDALEADKNAVKICVTGNVTSGTIDLKLIENDKNGSAAQTFEYHITDTLNETIELDKKHSANWTAVVDFNENTEGHYAVEVFS